MFVDESSVYGDKMMEGKRDGLFFSRERMKARFLSCGTTILFIYIYCRSMRAFYNTFAMKLQFVPVFIIISILVSSWSTALNLPQSVILEKHQSEARHLQSNLQVLVDRQKQQRLLEKTQQNDAVFNATNPVVRSEEEFANTVAPIRNETCIPCDSQMQGTKEREENKDKGLIDRMFKELQVFLGGKDNGTPFLTLLVDSLLQIPVKEEEIPMEDFVSILTETLDQLRPLSASLLLEQATSVAPPSNLIEMPLFGIDPDSVLGMLLQMIVDLIQNITLSSVGVAFAVASLFLSIIIILLSLINGILAIGSILLFFLITTRGTDVTLGDILRRIFQVQEESVIQMNALTKTLWDVEAEISNNDNIGLSAILTEAEAQLDLIAHSVFTTLNSSSWIQEDVLYSDTFNDSLDASIANIRGVLLRTGMFSIGITKFSLFPSSDSHELNLSPLAHTLY